jgi:hypothetical protein
VRALAGQTLSTSAETAFDTLEGWTESYFVSEVVKAGPIAKHWCVVTDSRRNHLDLTAIAGMIRLRLLACIVWYV